LPPLAQSKPFLFVYILSGGATHDPNTFTALYGPIKGEAEIAESELQSDRPKIDSARPTDLDDPNHNAIKLYISNARMAYHVMGAMHGPLFRTWLCKDLASPTEILGLLLTGMAMGKYEIGLPTRGKGNTTLSSVSRRLDN
jgi:hypothetical protein